MGAKLKTSSSYQIDTDVGIFFF